MFLTLFCLLSMMNGNYEWAFFQAAPGHTLSFLGPLLFLVGFVFSVISSASFYVMVKRATDPAVDHSTPGIVWPVVLPGLLGVGFFFLSGFTLILGPEALVMMAQ
jgi:hypothetical protein